MTNRLRSLSLFRERDRAGSGAGRVWGAGRETGRAPLACRSYNSYIYVYIFYSKL